MAEKMKIKKNGIVSTDDIPEDVSELELECDEITDLAFRYHKRLRSLKLVNVKRVGERAFNGCCMLLSAELVNCEEIAKAAFMNCKRLQKVTLNGVRFVGECAFTLCRELETVEINGCETIKKRAFYDCKKITSANADCRIISERAFERCKNLKEITLPNAEVIEYRAFYNTALREVKLPDALREFSVNAFYSYNDELFVEKWDIPQSFKPSKKLKLKIGGTVGSGDIPNDIEELELECGEVKENAFYKNRSLRILKLVNVKTIHKNAFFDMKKLMSLEIVNCGEIDTSAFEKSRELLKVKLTNIDTICADAFKDCKNLTCLELAGCTLIDENAFSRLNSLKSAAIDCKYIKDEAFTNCTRLENITLKNTISIGKCAFLRCAARSIKLPETLTALDDEAFNGTHINHLTIPPSVTKLGDGLIPSQWYYFDHNPEIEIYIKDGKAAFWDPHITHIQWHIKIIVRSEDTGEILCKFLSLDHLEMVLTDHGIDFTEYDRQLAEMGSDGVTMIEAARMRIKDPVGMREGMLEKLKEYVSEKNKEDLKRRMDYSYHFRPLKNTEEYDSFEHYDELSGKALIELILYSKEKDLPPVTKILTDHLHYRINNSITVKDLAEMIRCSSQLGFTELTAALMQRLHEKGGDNRGLPELEL